MPDNMNIMTKTCLLGFFLSLLPLASLSANENNRLGLDSPKSLFIDENTLSLVGEGRQVKYATVIYGCALYILNEQETRNNIVSLTSPFAFRVKITFDSLPDKMPAQWVSAIRDSIRDTDFHSIQNIYKNLNFDDVVVIYFNPDIGTSIIVNGKKSVTVEGSRLMRSFVSIWLGDDPVSPELKTALLLRKEE